MPASPPPRRIFHVAHARPDSGRCRRHHRVSAHLVDGPYDHCLEGDGHRRRRIHKTYTVCIQFGAILAVVALYWRRFFQSLEIYYKLFIAFLPALVFGALLYKHIRSLLDNVLVVAVSLLAGGIVLLFVDRWFARNEREGNERLSYLGALKVGLFQVISMVAPGISRSAATIVGGLTQRLTRRAAAEFSFLLAVPTMFAATCKELYEQWKQGHGVSHPEMLLLLLGSVVAFFVALVTVRAFVGYLTRYGFRAFGWYRIAIGLTIIVLLRLGVSFSML